MRSDPRTLRLAAVRVFREDLDQIAALAANDGKVEFRSDGFVYDSLEELARQLPQGTLRSLVIQPVGAGEAAVAVNATHAEVFALSDDSTRARQIAALLRANQRGGQPLWWRTTFASVAWLVSILLGVLVWWRSDLASAPRALVGGFVSVFSISILTSIQRSLAESVIYLRRREDATRLAQRTPIAVAAAISGLLGILIGALFL